MYQIDNFKKLAYGGAYKVTVVCLSFCLSVCLFLSFVFYLEIAQ